MRAWIVCSAAALSRSGNQFREQAVIVEGMRMVTKWKESCIGEILRRGMYFLFLCKRHSALLKSRVWNLRETESRGSGVIRKGFVCEKGKLAILCCVYQKVAWYMHGIFMFVVCARNSYVYTYVCNNYICMYFIFVTGESLSSMKVRLTSLFLKCCNLEYMRFSVLVCSS